MVASISRHLSRSSSLPLILIAAAKFRGSWAGPWPDVKHTFSRDQRVFRSWAVSCLEGGLHVLVNIFLITFIKTSVLGGIYSAVPYSHQQRCKAHNFLDSTRPFRYRSHYALDWVSHCVALSPWPWNRGAVSPSVMTVIQILCLAPRLRWLTCLMRVSVCGPSFGGD